MRSCEHYIRRLEERVQIAKEFSNKLKNIWLRRRFTHLHLTASVSLRADIYGSQNISIGRNVTIFPHAVLQCSPWKDMKKASGSITIGEGTTIQPYAYLHTDQGNIEIGNFCSVNPFCMLYGQGGLTIGNYVRIAAHTVIVPSMHNFELNDIPIHSQGKRMLGVTIDDDVWIGAGVRILDGVHITKGCIVGAGSVVTKSTKEYGVYAGVPAKKIKNR